MFSRNNIAKKYVAFLMGNGISVWVLNTGGAAVLV
jgi:hypothetical protein